MHSLLLTMMLTLTAGHANASNNDNESLTDRLASTNSEAQCLSILESLGNESEALIDQCMDQDYND